MSPRAPLGPS